MPTEQRTRCVFSIPFTGLASLLIGLLQVLWSLIPLVSAEHGNRSLFVRVLHETGTGDDWLAVMLLSGLLLSLTSVALFRSLRHVSLFISSAVMLASFGVFAFAGVVTPVTLSLPLLGLYAFALLVIDVTSKRRRLRDV